MSLAEPDGFREFVVARSPRLVHTAYLLTGDTHLARDLVQAALARTWPHWGRVRDGNPEAYVRTVMMRLNASWWRRRWRGEVPTDVLPEPGAAAGGGMPSPTDALDDRLTLASALATLPPGQRRVVVLRYVEDLSVESVAEILGCSEGTVKSQAARGLAKLREVLTRDGDR
mgnify:CR=1 FL=1